MHTLDLKVILKWAVWSAVLVFIGLAGRQAVGVQEQAQTPKPVETTVDGVRFRLVQVKSDRRGEARVVVEVYNETDDLRALPMRLELLSVVFSGDPMSRVASARDYKETVLDRKDKRDTIGPQSKNRYPGTLKGRAAPALNSDARYVVRLSLDGKSILAISVRENY